MADVAQKVINANEIYNNKAVVLVCPQNGTRKTKERDQNHVISTANMETKWTDRFDDRQYYSN